MSHVPIQIWCAIRPPNRAALSEGVLGLVDTLPCSLACDDVSGAHGFAFVTTGCHELVSQALSLVAWKVRIAASPEPSAYNQITAIRSAQRLGFRRGLHVRVPSEL